MSMLKQAEVVPGWGPAACVASISDELTRKYLLLRLAQLISWVYSFGVVWIWVSDVRSQRSWCLKGTNESTLGKDSSVQHTVPLICHHLGSLIPIGIIQKECNPCVSMYIMLQWSGMRKDKEFCFMAKLQWGKLHTVEALLTNSLIAAAERATYNCLHKTLFSSLPYKLCIFTFP